ncbi:MAG: ATP-binding protein [Rhodospirillales bacterium]|jgi:MinD superfamily P-loop ATPase|nr:ATP-binding protein [Rhodospirillales bacterium]
MIIAIASGKGGTGKTLVTAALATIWPRPVVAIDLDVEAPNLHLFLHPRLSPPEVATIEVPVADPARCSGCGACAELCQFKAVALFGDFPTVFPDMCHGCGGCIAVCPTGALRPGSRALGEIQDGRAGSIGFLMGRMRIGEALSPPLIRQVKARLADGLKKTAGRVDALIDSPPGASCPAVNAVSGADAVVLVTEPTPFGLHDLKLARHAFAALGVPLGVVINRAGTGEPRVYDYCRATNLPILAEIPFDRAIAATYARGETAVAVSQRYRDIFEALAEGIRDLAAPERTISHA